MALIPYQANPKFSVRPDNFRLVRDHPLADGLVLAGLGAHAGSTKYVDSSPLHRPGSLVAGATWKPDAIASHVTCASSGDYVNLYNGRLFDLLGGEYEPCTVCLWCYTTVADQRQAILTDWNPTASRDSIKFEFGGYLQTNDYLNIHVGQGSGNYLQLGAVLPNTWYHAAITYDGGTTNSVLGYFNGQYVGVEDRGATASTTGHILTISTQNTSYGLHLRGGVRDPMIWDRVLSPAEISQLANPADPMLSGLLEPFPTRTYFFPVEAETPPTDVSTRVYHHTPKYSVRPDNFRLNRDHPLADGLALGELGANGGTDLNVDSSAFKRHATWNNTDRINDGFGTIHGRLAWYQNHWSRYFGFSSESFAELPYDAKATFAAWVTTTTDAVTDGGIITKQDRQAPYNGWSFTRTGVDLRFEFLQSNPTQRIDCKTTSNFFVIGTPVHVAAIYDNQSVSFYVNGVQHATTYDYSGCTATPNYTTSPLNVGGKDNGQNGWFGLFADVMMWRRVLSELEISQLANPSDVMLSGLLEPFPTRTYFFPIGTAPPPTGDWEGLGSSLSAGELDLIGRVQAELEGGSISLGELDLLAGGILEAQGSSVSLGELDLLAGGILEAQGSSVSLGELDLIAAIHAQLQGNSLSDGQADIPPVVTDYIRYKMFKSGIIRGMM